MANATSRDSPLAIEITGLVKRYQSLRPLRIKSLNVAPRDRVAISGLDATAAELFVNVVNGAVLPDEGDIRVFGRSTRDLGTDTEWLEWLDRFGIMTNRAVLLESSSVAQNLALPLTVEIDPMSPDVEARVQRLAERVGLDVDLSQPLSQIEQVHRARVHLGRAVAHDPALLLLEHPTLHVPAERAVAFASDVKRVVEETGATLLALTQDHAFAETVATRVLRLDAASGKLSSMSGWRRWLG